MGCFEAEGWVWTVQECAATVGEGLEQWLVAEGH